MSFFKDVTTAVRVMNQFHPGGGGGGSLLLHES